jgi:UDP-2-acetamido-3-amino-2,3-dideoxy-glucuronate N-acetyltransferase
MKKIWLVGAGYWGSKIKECLTSLNIPSEIVDIKKGSSINDIDTLDPVILATPVLDHWQSARELLLTGHDLYVEKPLTATLEQSLDLQQSLQPNQILMAGYIFLYHPHLQILKDLITNDELGDIKSIKTERLNWGIYQTKISPLLSLAPHDISIVQYLTGADIQIEYAKEFNLSNNDVADQLYYTGVSNGIEFDTTVSWYSPVRRRSVTVVGTKQCAIWDTDAETLVVSTHNKISKTRLNTDVNLIEYRYLNKSPLALEIEHFVNCVRKRSTPITDIKHSVSIAQAIHKIDQITNSNH